MVLVWLVTSAPGNQRKGTARYQVPVCGIAPAAIEGHVLQVHEEPTYRIDRKMSRTNSLPALPCFITSASVLPPRRGFSVRIQSSPATSRASFTMADS